MAFVKTSVALRPPKPVDLTAPPEVGDIRDGKVWDGKKWVPETEWVPPASKEG
jgi:hypothetical protein